MLAHRSKRFSLLVFLAGMMAFSFYPYPVLAQPEGQRGSEDGELPRAEMSVGVSPILAICCGGGEATGPLVNWRLSGPFNAYLGAELGVGYARFSRASSGLLQGNLLVNLAPDRGATGRVIPFLTAGTGFIGAFPAWVVNYGGGLKYYFNERLGLRLDVRNQVLPNLSGFRSHFIEVGGGITIRF